MPNFNNRTSEINVAKIQKGNYELNAAVDATRFSNVETIIYYNNFIREEELRIQVPVLTHCLDNSKKDYCFYITFQDIHEYNGFDGYDIQEGNFVIFKGQFGDTPEEMEKFYIGNSVQDFRTKLYEVKKLINSL